MNTPIDTDAVEKQAKAIMDSFLHELGAVHDTHRFGLRRDSQMRAPKPLVCDEAFRRAFLENAPHVKDNQVIMEKKHW